LSDSLVIIPTYNEKENIEKMIRKVLSLPKDFHILVVDDGSPDGTGAIVKQLISEFPGRLFIEERPGKLGLGTAYIHGFKWGLKRNYQYLFEMDADFSHNPMIYSDYTMPARIRALMLLLVPVILKEVRCRTGPWDGY